MNRSLPPILGGIVWILGFLIPIFYLGIGCTMAVAVPRHMIVLKDSFLNPTDGRTGENTEIPMRYLSLGVVFVWIFQVRKYARKICLEGKYALPLAALAIHVYSKSLFGLN